MPALTSDLSIAHKAADLPGCSFLQLKIIKVVIPNYELKAEEAKL